MIIRKEAVYKFLRMRSLSDNEFNIAPNTTPMPVWSARHNSTITALLGPQPRQQMSIGYRPYGPGEV